MARSSGRGSCRSRRVARNRCRGRGVLLHVLASGNADWLGVGSVFLVAWIWWAVAGLDAEECKNHASREDTSLRLAELTVLSAGVALLAAVGLALIRAGNATGATKAYLITLGLLSVALSWGLVHTVFTLRYARSYYARPVGGIDFNEDDPPTYLDFAYLALTIGMTFQVSDTNLMTQEDSQDRSVARAPLLSVRSCHRRPCYQRGVQPPSLDNPVRRPSRRSDGTQGVRPGLRPVPGPKSGS